LFLDTLEFVIDAFGEKPFRPRGTLNVAVLDSVMVAIAWQRTPIGSPQKRYKRLLEDAEYSKAVNQATADEISVKERIKLAIEYFS
jgi:hypothetical protein